MAGNIEPSCAACGYRTMWVNDGWVCLLSKCESEWNSEHSIRYVDPANQPEWVSITSTINGRRCDVYWRLHRKHQRIGDISRRGVDGKLASNDQDTVQWRAFGFAPVKQTASTNVELGYFKTRREAEEALLGYWESSFTVVQQGV